jgi:hypothetical protein
VIKRKERRRRNKEKVHNKANSKINNKKVIKDRVKVILKLDQIHLMIINHKINKQSFDKENNLRRKKRKRKMMMVMMRLISAIS